MGLLMGATVFVFCLSNIFTASFNFHVRAGQLQVEEDAPRLQKEVRKRWKTRATPCAVTSIDAVKEFARSQYLEDKHLFSSFFSGLCGGSYVELGGLNGVRFSNTYMFANAMNWTGVLLELSPTKFKELQVNRPNDVTVNAAVCGKPRTLHWVENKKTPATSGVWEFSSQSHREKWWPGRTIDKATPVECRGLGELLETNAPDMEFFDFLSLDIEGAEFEAIQSIDWNRHGFGVIVVEANERNPRKNMAVQSYLVDHGYQFLYSEKKSDWFVSKDFYRIYQDVVHAAGE